jgi:hypothetical protein
MFNAAPDATGYAIATGSSSGVAVIDVDGPEAHAEAQRLGLQSGYVVKTGRTEGDGWHLYLSIPAGVELRSRNFASGLELKAEGSYVVGPGSLHPSGTTYCVVKDGEPSPTPEWILEPEPVATPREAADCGPGTADLAGPPILEGERNLQLTRIAGRLHDGTRDLSQLAVDLMAVNDARCTPSLEIYRREPCKAVPKVTPAVLAAIGDLEAIASERPKRGMGGSSGWSIYMAGLEAARQYGAEHPDGVELSLDLRTWAQMAGTHAATVSRFIRRSALVRRLQRGSGRQSGTVLFIVRGGIGAYLQHSSTGGGYKENVPPPGSVATRPLLRTLYRLRWGPGRIGKSRAALLTAVVECPGVSRFELARRLGRKPESLKKPLKWLVNNGLAVRVGWGRYDVPEDFVERVEDARELGREPEADRLQIARHDRERDGYRSRHKIKAEPVPTHEEMQQRREKAPDRRREAIKAAVARLLHERPEYRTRRAGQITCALVNYLPPDFPQGTEGFPKDVEVEELLEGVAA